MERMMKEIVNNQIQVCRAPFEFCEIHSDGNVYPCCPAYCKAYSFGNLNDNTFEEIWNSEKANKFREHLLNGDYSVCDMKTCTFRDFQIPPEEIKNKYYIEANKVSLPKTIKMCWDKECNVACITCRNCIKRNSPDDEKRLENYKAKLMPVLSQLDYFYVSGEGDPFGSRYARNLIKQMADENPKLKFYIHTNGVLCTESICKKLGIYDRIENIEVSIHAATEKTYNKIVKYGNFKAVLNNLKWLSKCKSNGSIKTITMILVISNINYQEIPAFIKLAKKYNAKAKFSYYRYWGTEYGKNYDEIAVWKPSHPKHWKFLEVISNPTTSSDAFFQNMISDLKTDDIKTKIKKLKREYYRKKVKNIVAKVFKRIG